MKHDLNRISISLSEELLEKLDTLVARRGKFGNRSEAVRDLIRDYIVEEEWSGDSSDVAATITLVYDHHTSELSHRLGNIQHDYNGQIISTLHVHMDHENCLEVIILRGSSKDIKDFADLVIGLKGVKYGKLTIATTGEKLAC